MPLSAMLFAAWIVSHGGIAETDARWSHTGDAATGVERPADSQPPSASGDTNLDDIAQQLAMAAQLIRDQAPIREPGATITGARSQGRTLTTTMTIAVPVDEAMLGMMRQEVVRQACANAALRPLIRGGATITYEVTDSANRMFNATVDRCDGE